MTPLADACADAARDSSVGCVIVTGAGRGFCAGGDLKEGGADKAVVPTNPEVGSRTEQGFSRLRGFMRSAEHTSELQSIMSLTYDVFCWNKSQNNPYTPNAPLTDDS